MNVIEPAACSETLARLLVEEVDLLTRMETEHPHLRATMLAALGNVVPSHLLDKDLAGATPAGPARAAKAQAPAQAPLIQLSRSR